MSDKAYDKTIDRHVPIGSNGARLTELSGSSLQEQFTEADAVTGVLTFGEPFGPGQYIEILNRDSANSGTFTVNGMNILLEERGADKAYYWRGQVAGTPSAEVSVSGSTSYIVSRYT